MNKKTFSQDNFSSFLRKIEEQKSYEWSETLIPQNGGKNIWIGADSTTNNNKW